MLKSVKQILSSLPKILIDSIKVAFVILGGIEIVLSFTAFSLDIVGKLPAQIGAVVLAYVMLVSATICVKRQITRDEITLEINGMSVIVKQGDIFEADGRKIIPFNEYFDTQVDDNVIDKESLNGKLILEHLDEDGRKALNEVIVSDDNSSFKKQLDMETSKYKFPLGRIKVFAYANKEYLLLALNHFNAQNEAYTNRGEYEQTLRTMWKEIDRTNASKPVFLPLIGTGKTRIDDMREMSKFEFLKCILCTLRTSKIKLVKPITILLTKDTLAEINLYELKGVR